MKTSRDQDSRPSSSIDTKSMQNSSKNRIMSCTLNYGQRLQSMAAQIDYNVMNLKTRTSPAKYVPVARMFRPQRRRTQNAKLNY